MWERTNLLNKKAHRPQILITLPKDIDKTVPKLLISLTLEENMI